MRGCLGLLDSTRFQNAVQQVERGLAIPTGPRLRAHYEQFRFFPHIHGSLLSVANNQGFGSITMRVLLPARTRWPVDTLSEESREMSLHPTRTPWTASLPDQPCIAAAAARPVDASDSHSLRAPVTLGLLYSFCFLLVYAPLVLWANTFFWEQKLDWFTVQHYATLRCTSAFLTPL